VRAQFVLMWIVVQRLSCYVPSRHIVETGQSHVPAALPSEEEPGTHFTGGWVGPRAEIRSPDGPACSESLHRMSYSGQSFKK
jgi:hypothetical protein